MESKKWYTSKTVWLGVVLTLLGALQVVHGALVSGQPLDAAAIINSVAGVLLVVLRIWFTDQPIG